MSVPPPNEPPPDVPTPDVPTPDVPTPTEPAPTGPALAVPPRRRRRKSFLVAVVLALAVVAVGVVVAVRGWLVTGGPEGAVRGYLRALADGDAKTALGYGTIPAGPRTLLTDRVLAEQVRIAPIENVSTRVVEQNGERAKVRAVYSLAFAGGDRQVNTVFRLHRADGDWRLDRVAVATRLELSQASRRATLLGGPLPSGTVVIFPGAVPIDFDTDYLQVTPDSGVIAPDAGGSSGVNVEPSTAGRAAALAAVRRTLATCLGAHADPRCPMPSERAVPGSFRGTLTGDLAKEVDVDVATNSSGELAMAGSVDVRGGYQQLEFDNRLTTKSKTDYALPVDFRAYPVSPVVLRWQRP